MRVTAAERDLVQRFVAFLNLDITTTSEVENVFATAPMVTGPMRIPPDEVETYRRDQESLRALVLPLADAFGSPRRRRQAARSLVPTVRAGLGELAFPARFEIDDGGRLRATYTLNGVAVCCWVAIGLLIDPERDLLGRFGRCGACGRFNVTLVEKRKPRRHCPGHLDAYRAMTGAKRAKAYRKRLEEQKRLERERQKRKET